MCRLNLLSVNIIIIGFLISCSTPVKKLPKLPKVKKNLEVVQIDSSFYEFINQYDTAFSTVFNDMNCPGASVVIVKDNEVVLMKGYGLKEAGSTDSVDAKSMFRIGSLSKGFTSVLVGRLVEKGLLSWDDKVAECLPNFCLKNDEQTKRIEIKHLLSHTIGFPRHAYTDLLECGYDLPDILPKLKTVPLCWKEGEYYAYQNVAFALIEQIIQEKTHKSFQHWMNEEIFQKGNMRSASVTYEGLMAQKDIAHPHRMTRRKGMVELPITHKYFNASSAGGVNASITDMGEWLKILLGERQDIVKNKTLDYVFHPFVSTNNGEYYNYWPGATNSAYGMGWRIVDFKDKQLIHHGGSVNDYRSEIAIDRKNNIGICVLFNAQNSYAKTVIPDFFEQYALSKSKNNKIAILSPTK
jgi:beta-lactamase class C